MSQFCDFLHQNSSKDRTDDQCSLFDLFTLELQKKDAIRSSSNSFILKINQQENLTDGLTVWQYHQQGVQFRFKISLGLKNTIKQLQKRLIVQLNNQFKTLKIAYQKPKITLDYKWNIGDKSKPAKIFENKIKEICSILSHIIQRVTHIYKYLQKVEPYLDLYAMRECFQFGRSLRAKSSRISLKGKKYKTVSEVLRLLCEGHTTLKKLEETYIDKDIKKYDRQKKQITQTLEHNAKNVNKSIEQSILTSIQILSVQKQQILTFGSSNQQDNLSIISTAFYNFKKEITIHKDVEMENTDTQIYQSTLVKKQKTKKGNNQFENQIKFLIYIKGTFHPHIAEYYCQLEDQPFKSQAVYVQYYEDSLHTVRNILNHQKKLKIAQQISKVLNFLHYHRICHRDLKLDNVMIDKSLNIKVIDWGSVCSMYMTQSESGNLKVKDERLFSTQGYYQKYFQEVHHEQFGINYTQQQIDKGQYFDIYSFGLMLQKIFDLKNSDHHDYWLDMELQYICDKCREKNPADRLSAVEIEIYLTMLRKKLKKITSQASSSPV